MIWLKEIDATGLSNRTTGGRRKRSARTADNIARVEQLFCSQEDNPGTRKSPREIERVTRISHSSARRFVKQDLNLNVFRRREVQKISDADSTKRLAACRGLNDWNGAWQTISTAKLGSQMRRSSQFRQQQIHRVIVSMPTSESSVTLHRLGC